MSARTCLFGLIFATSLSFPTGAFCQDETAEPESAEAVHEEADNSEDSESEDEHSDEEASLEPALSSETDPGETGPSEKQDSTSTIHVEAKSETPEISSYDDIVAQVNAELGPNTSYNARMTGVWGLLRAFVEESSASTEKKIEALERFIAEFPEKNRHMLFAKKLRMSLISGKEIEPGSSVKDLRPDKLTTRNEIFGLKAGVGVFGATMAATLFTIRFEKFYWDIMRGQFSYGWMVHGGSGGMGGGIPIKLGKKNGRRELRMGLAVEFGAYGLRVPLLKDEEVEDTSAFPKPNSATKTDLSWWSYGVVLIPEIVYCARSEEGWVFTVTFQFLISTMNSKGTRYEDITYYQPGTDYTEEGEYNDSLEWEHERGRVFAVPPHFSILFGFAY